MPVVRFSHWLITCNVWLVIFLHSRSRARKTSSSRDQQYRYRRRSCAFAKKVNSYVICWSVLLSYMCWHLAILRRPLATSCRVSIPLIPISSVREWLYDLWKFLFFISHPRCFISRLIVLLSFKVYLEPLELTMLSFVNRLLLLVEAAPISCLELIFHTICWSYLSFLRFVEYTSNTSCYYKWWFRDGLSDQKWSRFLPVLFQPIQSESVMHASLVWHRLLSEKSRSNCDTVHRYRKWTWPVY